ncbi:hypothetical protein KR054_009050 [Drosophila jambulina]|nr:hypothetical protein KR054_009050 [Drosophila jambulina]
MEVDPSMSRLRQPTQAQAYQNGKPAHSGRSGPHKRQRVNHINQSVDQAEGTYATAASSAAAKVDDDAISEYDLEATFFILPDLSSFDAIIGLDLLKQAGASLCLVSGHLRWGNGEEKIDFHPCPDVNFTEVYCSDAPPFVRNAFLEMLKTRKKAFANPNEVLPYNTSVVATIRTVSEELIYTKLYPYPMGAADFVNQEIEDLLKNGIIQKSVSPYNNPIWVVDKKGTDDHGNRKMRLVIDFRKLNERTVSDKYPMPNINMILGNLGNTKYFSTLDLKSGYHQIILAERDNTNFEFRRLPFGLKNAGSIFQRTIDDILREQIGKFCYVYVDDVIIYSEDEDSHIKHVDWVLKSLHDANMRVSVEKSSFFKKRKLRNILASDDVMLRYPDYKKAFDLTTDASAHGIGAVLSQEGRPITMISRTLKDREVNYATNERELLAIVWALAKLRHYLYAVKDINIFTDHQPLTFAVSESNQNAKIKRWKARIDDQGRVFSTNPARKT